MFSRFFYITVVLSISLWYFHEYHTVPFMKLARNIPYLSPLMADIHRMMKPTQPPSINQKELLFSIEELSNYKGQEDSKGIYIAILGKVFDVQKGKKHYQPGSGYHVFTGRDASRAFVTGDFAEENASDDVIDLTHSELLSLKDWVRFYEDQYEYKGKLVGRYYTPTGEKTDYHGRLDTLVLEALKTKNNNEEDKKKFPPCNTSWSAADGSRVWCSLKSGGVNRNWVGVPRKLYQVGTDKHKCVCIQLSQLDDPSSDIYARRGHLEEYQECRPESFECFFK